MDGLCKRLSLCLYIFFLFLSAEFVQAKNIDKSASIATALDFSDNINLDHENEVSDMVLRVTPGIHFSKEGSRVKSALDYNFSALLYARETQKKNARHFLNAYIDSELVKNSVFLDLNASVSQQLLNPNLGASPDGVSGSDNLTQTFIYGATPYWEKNWGNLLESVLRYNYNEVLYDNKNADDSSQQSVALELDSGRKFNELYWGIDFRHTETDYKNLQDTSSDITLVTLGYHYSRKLNLVLRTGYEDYDTPQVTRNSGGNGVTVGVEWRPNSRNSLDLDIGNRFFGNTYGLDFNHRGRRLDWNFVYADELINQRDQARRNVTLLEEDPDGVLIPESSTVTRQGQYYLSRQLTNNFIFKYKKSRIGWRLFWEKRYYNVSEQENEERYGSSIDWQYSLGRRTMMDTSILWDYYNDIFTADEDSIGIGTGERTRITLSWLLNHSLTRDLNGFVRLTVRNNAADRSTNDYHENRISVGLERVF